MPIRYGPLRELLVTSYCSSGPANGIACRQHLQMGRKSNFESGEGALNKGM